MLLADGFGDLTAPCTSPRPTTATCRTTPSKSQAAAPARARRNHHLPHRLPRPVPQSIARNGYKRDFLMGGQWFPKLGVFWHGAPGTATSTTPPPSSSPTSAPSTSSSRAAALHRRRQRRAHRRAGQLRRHQDAQLLRRRHPRLRLGRQPQLHRHRTALPQSSMGPVQLHVLALAASPGRPASATSNILEHAMQQFDERYGPSPTRS
jgi:hypothetical protein